MSIPLTKPVQFAYCRALYCIVKQYVQHQQYGDAIQLMESLIDIVTIKDRPWLLLILCNIYLVVGQHDKAELIFSKMNNIKLKNHYPMYPLCVQHPYEIRNMMDFFCYFYLTQKILDSK